MRVDRVLTAVALCVPALTLAAVGQTHPHLLNPATAHKWWTLHVWLLPVFPLLPIALLALIRGDQRPVAWAARVLGFGFAVGYSALDAVDGIGAGLAVNATGTAQDRITGRMFQVGDRLGHAGIWALLGCVVLVAATLWSRHGWWVLPGVAVAVWGCHMFYEHHIFAPQGVRAMLALAATTAWLTLAPRRRQPGPA